MGVETFTLASGRRVGVRTLAEGAGRMVVFCHPAPGSAALDPDPEETAKREITLLGLDRSGYGRSEPMPAGEWASVDRAAMDIAEVLEARGKGPVGVAGWSAGGRVAVALAALRPELVERVVIMAAPAPDEEVPWVPEAHRPGLAAMSGRPADEVHAALEGQLAGLVPNDAGAPEALALVGAGEADRAVLDRPGVCDRLTGMLAEAFVQGATGLAQDIAGYSLRPWGFAREEVKAKALLLYGSADPIGARHAKWWKAGIPNARIEMVPGAGHLVAISMWKRALAHLAPDPKRAS